MSETPVVPGIPLPEVSVITQQSLQIVFLQPGF